MDYLLSHKTLGSLGGFATNPQGFGLRFPTAKIKTHLRIIVILLFVCPTPTGPRAVWVS